MDTDETATPKSGRKKKSLLSKMAQRKAAKEMGASQESLQNGSKQRSLEDSLTQVSIDQSPVDGESEGLRSRTLISNVQTRTVEVEGVEDSPKGAPKPVPRNRVRQSFDLSDGHWTKPKPQDSRDSSPLISSDDDDVTVDSFEHKVEIHDNHDSKRMSSSRKLRNRTNGDGASSRNNNRRSRDSPGSENSEQDGQSSPEIQENAPKSFSSPKSHRRPEKLNLSENAVNSKNDSSPDSEAEELINQYESVLTSSISPKEPLPLTKENLHRKESLERQNSELNTSMESGISFTRTNRLKRLNNMSRGLALTPTSEVGSAKSCATTSSLPLITTQSVRERSFLVGSMGPSGLLGVDELERLFPDRRLKVFQVTWNMFENKPENLPRSLNDIMLPEDVEYMPDLCVVNTQEACTDKREWEIRLQETIGPTHVLFCSVFHGDLHTCVFLRRDLIWYCSVPEWDKITFRPAVRTKGSLAIAFSIFGTSFLFLNSHFMSGDGRLDLRLSDYRETITSLKLPAKPTKPYTKDEVNDVTARYDVTFWGGDMNFRINRPRHIVDNIVSAIEHQEHPDYEELLVGCELYKCKNEGPKIPGIGLAFQRFQEGRINFPPSYKYDVNEQHLYDTSEKNRIPSYCDRILFRTRKKQQCVCLYYSSIDSIKVSDHHPVCGLYDVELRPGKDCSKLAAGRFNREVYVEANRRRAQYRTIPALATEKRSSVCSIS